MSADRLLAAFRELVRAEFPQLTYLGLWEYTVVLAAADPTSGVVSISATPTLAPGRAPVLPALAGVPVRPGVAGASVVPAIGSTCLVAFVNGDPGRPEVLALDATAPTSIAIQGLAVSVGPASMPLAKAGELQAFAAAVVAACAAHTPPITIAPLAATVATTILGGT